MKKLILALLTLGASPILAMAMPLAAKAAATTVTVTPTNNDGWATADTRPGGAVQYVYDPTSPSPDGALQLVTDNTTASKAQYMHTANTALADVTNLSYYTKQLSASSPTGDPSYQLAVCLGGFTNNTCSGFTTLVYEPYWNTSQSVLPNTWQQWDVTSGQFWSSRDYADSANTACTVTAGSGGQPFYTLADLTTSCPSAQVVGFGVNVGTSNPSYVVETDQIVFNDFTYDFELTNAPASKDDCKSNGFSTLTDENGQGFKNQGDCVSYFNRSTNDHHMSVKAVSVTNKNDKAAYNGTSGSGNSGTNNSNNTNNAQNQPQY